MGNSGESLDQLIADARVCFQAAHSGDAPVELAGDILIIKAQQMAAHSPEGRELVQSLCNACSQLAVQEWLTKDEPMAQNPWSKIAGRLEELLA
jgi:cytochrome c5